MRRGVLSVAFILVQTILLYSHSVCEGLYIASGRTLGSFSTKIEMICQVCELKIIHDAFEEFKMPDTN